MEHAFHRILELPIEIYVIEYPIGIPL